MPHINWYEADSGDGASFGTLWVAVQESKTTHKELVASVTLVNRHIGGKPAEAKLKAYLKEFQELTDKYFGDACAGR